MSSTSSSEKTGKARRQEEFWNRVTFLVWCSALVGMIASIVVVLSQQVMRSPMVDESYLQNSSAETKVPVTTASSQAPVPKALPLTMGIEDIEAKRDRIGRTLKAFFAATTVDAMLPLVRDANRVNPLMKGFYARKPMPALTYQSLGQVVRVDEPGYRFGYVQVLFADAPPATLIVEEQDNGGFLVDWEWLVRYGEVSWSEFLQTRPVEPTLLRVIASRPDAPPVTGLLPSKNAEWLELRHPDEAGTVLGRFDRTDPRFAPLVNQLQQGNGKDVPVTLRLCYPMPPGQDAGLVNIAGVEGKGWLILGAAHGL